MKPAVWQPWGPAFNSVEDTRYGNGFLSVDYTDNVDTRWPNQVVLGPLKTVVTCTAAGGTPANTNGFALSGTINAVVKLFAIRGTKWAKIKASDMTLLSDGTETALTSAATDILYTKTSGGTQEISVAQDPTNYVVITTANDTATDTFTANDDAEVVRIFGLGWPADRIVGLTGNVIKATVLTGGVTMDNPAFATLATIAGEALTPTGFVMDGKEMIPCYDNGPYFLDSDYNRFRPLIDEIDTNSANGKQATTWFAMGSIIPLYNGTRYQKYLSGRSIGPETYSENMSPIQGRATAVASTNQGLYLWIYNEPNDDTYICFCKPSTREGKELDFYPLMTVENTNCDSAEFIGTALGARTNPTMVFGHDSNVAWFTLGRTTRDIDDTNYTYATSGTLYLTEMRRDPLTLKRIKRVMFETAGCNTSGENITFQMRVTDERGAELTEQIGAPITTNGMQILTTPDPVIGWRLRPQLVFASDTSSSSPSIESVITVEYEEMPLRVNL